MLGTGARRPNTRKTIASSPAGLLHYAGAGRRFREAQPLAIDFHERDDTGRTGGDPVPMSLEMLSTTTLPAQKWTGSHSSCATVPG
jgi:hypothetical protein